MESKLVTLSAIYEMVKNQPDPTTALIQSSELILQQSCAWDEVGNNLKELQTDGLVTMKQLITAVVSITEKGIQYIRR